MYRREQIKNSIMLHRSHRLFNLLILTAGPCCSKHKLLVSGGRKGRRRGYLCWKRTTGLLILSAKIYSQLGSFFFFFRGYLCWIATAPIWILPAKFTVSLAVLFTFVLLQWRRVGSILQTKNMHY